VTCHVAALAVAALAVATLAVAALAVATASDRRRRVLRERRTTRGRGMALATPDLDSGIDRG
jgi:hypothetical protein